MRIKDDMPARMRDRSDTQESAPAPIREDQAGARELRWYCVNVRGLRCLIVWGFESLSMVGLILLAVISVLTSLFLNLPRNNHRKGKHMRYNSASNGMLGLSDSLVFTVMGVLKAVSIGAMASAVSS